MPRRIRENEVYFQALLDKRMIYLMKLQALEQGITLRTLTEKVMKEYLKTKGVNFDEESTKSPS